MLPDTDDPDLLATVRCGGPCTPTERDHQLFDAIDRRHTHRAPFAAGSVPQAVLDTLRSDARRSGADLHVVTDRDKPRVAVLVAEGDRIQLGDRRFRQELASWVRPNTTRRGDGMPGYAFGISTLPSLVGPLLMRTIDLGRRQAAEDARLTSTAPALLLLTTPTDSVADWLAAGQAVGTLLLSATSAGLAASFLNQPIETHALRAQLVELVAPAAGQPQLLLRLGRPASAGRPTPRRPVDDVLTVAGGQR